MARPRSDTVLALIAVGGLLVLALVVYWLEGEVDAQAPEPAAIVEGLGGAPAHAEIEALRGSSSRRVDRPRRSAAPRRPPRRGPLQIIVHVSDRSSGQPVPGFQVTILPHQDGNPLSRLGQGVPTPFHQRQGVFRVQQQPGLYDVVVIAPRYLPGVLRAVEVPAASVTPLELPLDSGPGIAGTVTGEDGLARAGIDVYLDLLQPLDPAAKRPLITKTRSGIDGRFSFSPLPAGEYALCLLWPDNRDDRVAGIRVRQSTIEVPMLLLARHQISFQVSDNQGRPLREARLELRGAGHFVSAATNEAGLAVLDNLPDGTYQLTVRQPGYHELVDELRLQGGLGEHVRYLRLLSESEG